MMMAELEKVMTLNNLQQFVAQVCTWALLLRLDSAELTRTWC